VLAVYSATKAAIGESKVGGGPTMIECFTYRLAAHTTSDDPTKYRKKMRRGNGGKKTESSVSGYILKKRFMEPGL